MTPQGYDQAMIPCLVRERNTLALLDLGNSRTTSFTNEFVWRVRGKPQRILWFILNFPAKMIIFGVCQIFRHKSAFALLRFWSAGPNASVSLNLVHIRCTSKSRTSWIVHNGFIFKAANIMYRHLKWRDLMRERLMLEWGFITCYSGSSPINENAGHQNKAAKLRSDLQMRTTLWHLNFNLWIQIMRNDRFQFQKLKTGKRGFSSVKPARWT